MTSPSFKIVLVTAPDVKTARKLARKALEARLVACASLVPKIESLYWWQAKIEQAAESLIVFKTTRARLAKLEKLILSEHPYDTPEFLVLPVQGGSTRYLAWLQASCLG
jgi:periplasmic divalent cation tolerance protein